MNTSASLYFAIECTYAITTATFLERFSPVYRVPQHNKKAACEVDVDIVDAIGETEKPAIGQSAFEGVVGVDHDDVVVPRQFDQLHAAVGIDETEIAEQDDQATRPRYLTQAHQGLESGFRIGFDLVVTLPGRVRDQLLDEIQHRVLAARRAKLAVLPL